MRSCVLIAALMLVWTTVGCAFDPICEPGEPECDFAQEPQNSVPPDTSVPDDASIPDTSRPDVTPTDPDACPAPNTCGNEPDHIDKSLVWTEPYGCDPEFQARTVTLEDAVCDGDSDWHGIWIAPCENRSYVVEAIVKPATPACLNLMRINIADEDGFRLCGSRAARCEQLPDGSLRASLLVQASGRRGDPDAFFFVIDSTTETDAPYTITVTAFQ